MPKEIHERIFGEINKEIPGWISEEIQGKILNEVSAGILNGKSGEISKEIPVTIPKRTIWVIDEAITGKNPEGIPDSIQEEFLEDSREVNQKQRRKEFQEKSLNFLKKYLEEKLKEAHNESCE